MITTIINYCTNDYRFLGRCIQEAKAFSSSILISVCDHFFDGTPEHRALLEATYAKWPDCQFLEFAWDVKQLYTPFLSLPAEEEERICLWHSTARFVACHFLPEETEYVLFLDADEIAEGDRFATWCQSEIYRQFDALWFFAYRYRFCASERRLDHQYAPLLIRKSALPIPLVLNAKERYGLLLSMTGSFWLKGLEDRPFFHHYSWVRTKEENLRKVRTWAKRPQMNWVEELKNAWKEERFLEEGPFEKGEPFFNPLTVELPSGELLKKERANVIRLNRHTLFRRELEGMLFV